MHCEVHTGHGNGKHCPINKQAARDVALDFNPAGLEDIEIIKALSAALISLLEDRRTRMDGEAGRCAAIARERLQDASMWGVKAMVLHASKED